MYINQSILIHLGQAEAEAKQCLNIQKDAYVILIKLAPMCKIEMQINTVFP